MKVHDQQKSFQKIDSECCHQEGNWRHEVKNTKLDKNLGKSQPKTLTITTEKNL